MPKLTPEQLLTVVKSVGFSIDHSQVAERLAEDFTIGYIDTVDTNPSRTGEGCFEIEGGENENSFRAKFQLVEVEIGGAPYTIPTKDES